MTTTIRLVIVATTALLVTLTGAARAADVPFVTGGAGADERADLQAKEKGYNLKVVAAATSGDYLADVWVVIESAVKKSVLGSAAASDPRAYPSGTGHARHRKAVLSTRTAGTCHRTTTPRPGGWNGA